MYGLQKCATEILSAIGGRDNIASAAHCATRLRLVIADNSRIKKDILENVDGVKGVFESAGQLQIIIGTGTVNKVYDEFIKEACISAASKDDVKKLLLHRHHGINVQLKHLVTYLCQLYLQSLQAAF